MGGGCNYMGFVWLHGGIQYIQTYTWSLWGGGCNYMGFVRLHGWIRYIETYNWSLWGGDAIIWGLCGYMEEYGISKHIPGVYWRWVHDVEDLAEWEHDVLREFDDDLGRPINGREFHLPVELRRHAHLDTALHHQQREVLRVPVRRLAVSWLVAWRHKKLNQYTGRNIYGSLPRWVVLMTIRPVQVDFWSYPKFSQISAALGISATIIILRNNYWGILTSPYQPEDKLHQMSATQ